eukprot:TRINITY_DN4813_c0_g2_i1.p1 TRINITY_DN4813_c0_g2~~TRINITY_DN4813_c0_g2_i1.p1  ORF type:complete len:566 (-),score=80.97 TRINITY_DN4813_c0_g2_i1:33-1730(-)
MDRIKNWIEKWRKPKDGITPLPKKVLFVIAIIYICESFSQTMLYAFVVFMITDFNIASDSRDIGRYVGVLAGSFSIAQFLSSFGWGYLSDRIGRRKILLIGLAGNAITTIAFGLSVNFPMALASRFLQGLLNGNIGVARTYLSEVTDSTNQGKGMSVTSLSWGLGLIVAPSLAGVLCQPVLKYPHLFSEGGFFDQFPYSIPCFLSGALTLIGFVSGYFIIEEKSTNKTKQEKKYIQLKEMQTETQDESEEKNISEDEQSLSQDSENDSAISFEATEGREESLSSTITIPPPKINNSTILIIEDEQKPKEEKEQERVSLLSLLKQTDIYTSLLCYLFLVICVVLYLEMFTLWATSSITDGGLNFKSDQIGFALTSIGFVLVPYQLFVFPNIERKIGSLRLFRVAMFCQAIVFPCFPLLNNFLSNKYALWIGLFIANIFRASSTTTAYTSLYVLINNSVDPRKRGSVNGIAESIASVAKGCAPIIGGLVFSWSLTNGMPFPFNYFFVFLMASTISGIGWILSLRLSKRIDSIKHGYVEVENKDLGGDNGEIEEIEFEKQSKISTVGE